jgi:ABC-type protease/lipase transport system fused ATPase/permease subunit
MVGEGALSLASAEVRAIAIARALHGTPQLLVLDEPEAGLDAQAEKRLVRTLIRIKNAGIGLVVATQQPRLLSLVNKVVVLRQGEVEMFGATDVVLKRLQAERAEASQMPAIAARATNHTGRAS